MESLFYYFLQENTRFKYTICLVIHQSYFGTEKVTKLIWLVVVAVGKNYTSDCSSHVQCRRWLWQLLRKPRTVWGTAWVHSHYGEQRPENENKTHGFPQSGFSFVARIYTHVSLSFHRVALLPNQTELPQSGCLWLLTFFFLSRSNIPSFLVDDVNVSCFCKAVSMWLLSFQSLPSFSSLACHFAIRFFPTTVYVSFYDHHLALLHLPGILPLLPDFFCQHFSPLLRYLLLSIMLFSSQVILLLLPW